MSYTKGELADAALEEIGIASYEFDISPEQRQSVIMRLDSMIAMWGTKGILLSYPISKVTDSHPDQDSNIPDWSWEAVITNLAIKVAPSYGKAVSPDTKVAAKEGYNALLVIFAQPKEMQFPSMPKGAGYKTTEFRYTPSPESKYLDRVDDSFDPSGGPINE